MPWFFPFLANTKKGLRLNLQLGRERRLPRVEFPLGKVREPPHRASLVFLLLAPKSSTNGLHGYQAVDGLNVTGASITVIVNWAILATVAIRYNTFASGDETSFLSDYVSRMKKNQKDTIGT